MTVLSSICLIDDDNIYQYYSKSLILTSGKAEKVLQFFDGQEALEFLTQHQHEAGLLPELILLDLEMPYMDGWQFLDQFSQLQLAKEVTLYIASSSTSMIDQDRAKKYPQVKGYMIKPMRAEQFVEIINSVTNTPEA
ncbi:response regulator [Rufibacter quisquiliarum]|uniref:CheY-like chemotaxis protein n=1 Tax=Rufibacter quisquiliarum TaxID=1549639 RepID=A0A839G8V6_9BACT|nr:response regulator [Rufibacter quisquiliarum]MBA9075884.1 CheY-like chemotaxis protein [Rufibacter quisquiliarum]